MIDHPTMKVNTECEKPSCDREMEREYRDDNSNTLSLCKYHYYLAVVGYSTDIESESLTFQG